MSTCSEDCSCAKRKRLNTPMARESDDDDVWLSDGDEEHFRPADIDRDEIFGKDVNAPEHVETLALRRAHAKQGFIEGLAEAKARATQKGFDEGYRNGSSIGLKVGEIISTLHCLKSSRQEAIATQAAKLFDLAKKDLYIANVLNHRYFDEDINLVGETHELIVKWETAVSQLKGQLAQ